ncbi:MAG: hypothetical protein KBA75_08875 [Alphaproteobacteria bacterium]|nr:hypothetical protein [Alphaproteobacteria bacterium]
MNARVPKEHLTPASVIPEPEKLGGLLLRMPDLIVAPRDVTLEDGVKRHDPGGTIARWQVPGNDLIGVTVINGFGTTVEKEGLQVARILNSLYGDKKRRPAITLFDYRGFGESKGLALADILPSRTLADAATMLRDAKVPQIVVAISIGAGNTLIQAQKEFARTLRYHAPRKILGAFVVNPAVLKSMAALDRKAKLFAAKMRRTHPEGAALSSQVAENFILDGQRHNLKNVLSPHNLLQPVFGCPIVVIQGMADKIVSPQGNEQMVLQAAAPAKLFVPLAGVGHDLTAEGAGLELLKDMRFPLNGKQVTLVEWMQQQLAPDRGWIIRDYALPKVAPAVRKATSEGAQSLWQAAARATLASGQALVRAAHSAVAQRAKASVARQWQSAMNKLLPPKVHNEPPTAPDTEAIRRLHPPRIPPSGDSTPG